MKKQAPCVLLKEKCSTASSFLKKKRGSSLFIQKKIGPLIISSEKNEAPHYFFRKKMRLEIMMRFIFF